VKIRFFRINLRLGGSRSKLSRGPPVGIADVEKCGRIFRSDKLITSSVLSCVQQRILSEEVLKKDAPSNTWKKEKKYILVLVNRNIKMASSIPKPQAWSATFSATIVCLSDYVTRNLPM
jgi:hypothetical protein